MTTKKKSKKKKVKKKEDWSEISFSTSELTYYDLIVEEKNLNSIEKISEQISNVIEGGENESTSHMVLGDLNHYKDKALSSSYLTIDSTDITSFDYTIQNQGKLVTTPKKGEVVFLFYYRYDHAGYSLTKNKNYTNVCFKVKSFKNEAVLTEMDDPGFELTAHDASGGGVMYLEIICANGKTFEGSVEGKDDLIQEFHTYLTNKQKKLSQDKGKNYLIKILPGFLFSEIHDLENDEGVDPTNNPTEKAKNYCVDRMKNFIDEFKEKFDGVIGEKILISYNSEDFYDLSELKNTLDSNFEYLSVYILLKTKILGEELNNIFLSMSDYGFYADYPYDEEKIITQGYDKGEYDTGYFAANASNDDPEGYISDKNNPMSLSLKKYNEVMKTLAE